MTMCKFVFNPKKGFIKQILNSTFLYIKKGKYPVYVLPTSQPWRESQEAYKICDGFGSAG